MAEKPSWQAASAIPHICATPTWASAVATGQAGREDGKKKYPEYFLATSLVSCCCTPKKWCLSPIMIWKNIKYMRALHSCLFFNVCQKSICSYWYTSLAHIKLCQTSLLLLMIYLAIAKLIDLPCFFTRHLCIEFLPQQEVKPFTVPCTAGSVCVWVMKQIKRAKRLQRQDKIDVNMKRHLIPTALITILIHML